MSQSATTPVLSSGTSAAPVAPSIEQREAMSLAARDPLVQDMDLVPKEDPLFSDLDLDGEAERRYHALLRSLAQEFPGFRLVRKRDDRLQRVIGVVLRCLTLGHMSGYLSHYQTTLGRTVYITDSFADLPPVERWATLRHEAVHMRQFRRWGLVGMAVLYLLVPLPAGLAYFRMRLERAAYEETLCALHEARGAPAVCDPALRAHVIAQFTSAAYGWMWPFPAAVGRWYDRFVAALTAAD